MILRSMIGLFLSISISNAYFMTQNTLEVNSQMLKDFDVSADFFRSSMYSSSKAIERRYKTQYFLNSLKNGKDFIPLLRSLMEKNGIPDVFLYLAMAESNFSPTVRSNSRAVGIWQLIPATARKFGLKIDDYVDERKDPVKSTKAAIRYLKYLHNDLGKWYLVAMAYNCGEGRVRRAIRKAKSDKLSVLLSERKKYIPRETRRYINKILAIASVTSNPNFLIDNGADYLLNQGDTLPFEIIKVPPATSLSSVAHSIGISTRRLKRLNPQLRYYFTPPDRKKHDIYIPVGKKHQFAKNFKPSSHYKGFYVYRVKKGDTLWRIGRRYGIKHSLIKKFNNLRTTRLRLKQKLIIPAYRARTRVYVAKRGDTLSSISSKFRVKLNELIKRNDTGKYLQPGDKIVIP